MKCSVSVVMSLLFCLSLNAQNFEIKQDDDDVLFFNESKQSVEVWVRMQQTAVSEVVTPGKMKKFVNPRFLSKKDLKNSDIYYAYTYRALTADVNSLFEGFYIQLENRRKLLNRGAQIIEQPFYKLPVFDEFLESPEQKEQIENLEVYELDTFVENVVIPKPKNLLAHVNKESDKSHKELVNVMSKFIATVVLNDSEQSIFLDQMNKIETLFYNYIHTDNVSHDLGSLENNDFKLFTKNPSTEIGMYITTNSFGKIERYNYPEMDTRGFDFEVSLSQRFYQNRLSKRRTLNYHAAASYLSLKDKGFDFKKSFITAGPQLRYTGYYENQVALIAEAGAVMDITADKYMSSKDKKQFGYYVGGEISLLFIRIGVRYYDQLTVPELTPEGKLFYRLGLVAKF